MFVLLALTIGAYLLGSIPTGVMFARARGIDLRKIGSGNIGATNVGRALGKRWAVVVLLLDAAKGFMPIMAARQLSPMPSPIPSWDASIVGLAAVAGHSFSIFLRGRGGKGVATSLGAALALAPVPALYSFSVYLILYAIFRISSLGSLAGVASFPLLCWLFGQPVPTVDFGIVIAVLVVVRHRDNLKRLVRGEELKS